MHHLVPKPNYMTIGSILLACIALVDLHQGNELHDHIVRSEFDAYIVVDNALVKMYEKCGSIVATYESIIMGELSWYGLNLGFNETTFCFPLNQFNSNLSYFNS